MTDSNKWLLLAGAVLTGWLLYLLAPVLTPFLIAALLAYVATRWSTGSRRCACRAVCRS